MDKTMSIINYIALGVAAVIVIAAVGVAVYKHIRNKRADLSERY